MSGEGKGPHLHTYIVHMQIQRRIDLQMRAECRMVEYTISKNNFIQFYPFLFSIWGFFGARKRRPPAVGTLFIFCNYILCKAKIHLSAKATQSADGPLHTICARTRCRAKLKFSIGHKTKGKKVDAKNLSSAHFESEIRTQCEFGDGRTLPVVYDVRGHE